MCGSVGWKSTDFTRSDRASNFRCVAPRQSSYYATSRLTHVDLEQHCLKVEKRTSQFNFLLWTVHRAPSSLLAMQWDPAALAAELATLRQELATERAFHTAQCADLQSQSRVLAQKLQDRTRSVHDSFHDSSHLAPPFPSIYKITPKLAPSLVSPHDTALEHANRLLKADLRFAQRTVSLSPHV